MSIIGELLLANLLAYMINLASGERSAAFAATRERKLKEALEKDEALQTALASSHSIRDELRAACTELARNRAHLGVQSYEEPLWQLLSDEVFQTDLAEWLRAGAIAEGNDVKSRILQRMEAALANSDASQEQLASLKTGYFEAVDKAVFAHPVLAHWRHQLSLDYLREQVALLRQRADEAVGKYSPQKQTAALDRYCEKALDAWDIIDLSNLPADDIDIGTQQLLLRQLYMPLRIQVEPTKRGEGDDAALARLEEQREARRHREAGHLFADGPDRPDRTESRSPVGERLGASRRLVVLGDPGGGKTTMLRWMATAYLLRHKGDDAFSHIPDTQTLPSQPWIPVLIRCRDLGEADLCRCFTDFLTQHLNKTELLPEEANAMRAVLLDRIANGKALLLVDGLDEITNPQVRIMFCQELERTAARYPDAPIVVTSRIVGYRDMPYRMGSGFEHGVIAELSREDKDLFARRWVEVTEQHQPSAEKAKRVQELLDALHSSDRIERLTGNPMLLTTLALVKRKVGKLPSRRTKLYAEAVSVLLNWNPRRYQIIEEDEAIPQLEYLAYEMCRRGVQRLTDDEVLDLLDNLRIEYPKVRAVHSREPREFLKHLEERSSILIKSGGIWQKNKSQERPVWEFRHLTFQEYLAARAIHDGKYPNRGKPKSLAEQVARLAGAVEKAKRRLPVAESEGDVDVPESWREALRLLVADCKDDDVDDVLLAILNPMDGEDATKTGRPRAVLAALCLADEPNVSEENAQEVLSSFAAKVGKHDGTGRVETPVDRATMEVSAGIWRSRLRQSLVDEFFARSCEERERPGALLGMIEVVKDGSDQTAVLAWCGKRVISMQSRDSKEAAIAALGLVVAAFRRLATPVAEVIPGLLALLDREQPLAHAAAWALMWFGGGRDQRDPRGESLWKPTDGDLCILARALSSAPEGEGPFKRCLIYLLGRRGSVAGNTAITRKLDDADASVRSAAAAGLRQLGDKQAVAPLLAKLDDQDANVRMAVIGALRQLGDKQAVAPLLAKLDDPNGDIGVATAAALHVLGEPRGMAAMTRFLSSEKAQVRQTAVRSYARYRDTTDQRFLSRDLDATGPWLDPQEAVTEPQVANASREFEMTPDQVRSRYETMAVDLCLKLSWKG